jgi:hypothetical protein
MVASTVINTRIDADTRERFAALASTSGITESALMKRLILTALTGFNGAGIPDSRPIEAPQATKLSFRLRPDDQLLLRERAAARALPTGTYVSLLIRAHLRNLAPLPTVELNVLKASLAEVSAIGRNLNQIARTLNQGSVASPPTITDLQALMRALTALRDHFRSLINSNLASWNIGYEKAPR